MAESKKKTVLRFSVAVLISVMAVAFIALFFINLSEEFTGISESEDIRADVMALDETVWNIGNDGRREFERIFKFEAPKQFHINRVADESLLLDFGEVAIPVMANGGYLIGFLNGEKFVLSVSISHTGEGEALSLVSGESVIVCY